MVAFRFVVHCFVQYENLDYLIQSDEK